MKTTNSILPDIYSKNSFIKQKVKTKFNKALSNRGILLSFCKINKRDQDNQGIITPTFTQETSIFSKNKKSSNQLTARITLEQYFREIMPQDDQYHPIQQSLLPYIQHDFRIHQADQQQDRQHKLPKKALSKLQIKQLFFGKRSLTKQLKPSKPLVLNSKIKMKTQQTQVNGFQPQRKRQLSLKKQIISLSRLKADFSKIQQSYQLKQITERRKQSNSQLKLRDKKLFRQMIIKQNPCCKQNKVLMKGIQQLNIQKMKNAIQRSNEKQSYSFRDKIRSCRK